MSERENQKIIYISRLKMNSTEVCVDIIQDSVFSQLNFTIRDNTVPVHPGAVGPKDGHAGVWVSFDPLQGLSQ